MILEHPCRLPSGPVSGPTQQFANDKMKLKIVDNTKHSDAEENTETFLELKEAEWQENG